MSLPNLFKKNQPDQPQGRSFLSIFLTEEVVQSAWWELQDQEIEIISQSKVHYFTQPEQKIVIIDESLQQLGPGSEKISKVVFGFEPSWVNQTGLADNKKAFLKQVTEDLDLQAAGFVVITEALSAYLIDKKPLTSTVLVYLGEHDLHLVLIKQGEVVAQQSAGRSGDLVADLKETLARISQATAKQEALQLPPNLVLVSSSLSDTELKEQQQLLLSREWHQGFDFIQTPLITTLTQDKLIEAVVTQGGVAVLQSQEQGQVLHQESSQLASSPPASAHAVKSAQLAQQSPPAQQSRSVQQSQSAQSAQSNESPESSQITQTQTAVADSSQDQAADRASSFGVPIKKQIVDDMSDQAVSSKPSKTKRKLKMTKIKRIILLGAVFGLLAVLALGYFFLRARYQAIVKIDPAQQAISKDVQITLDPTVTQTDPEELILKVDQVEREIQGSDTRQTTGVKLVGEKAAGQVTIFNKTTEDKTFDKGTELTTDDLSFVLSEEVTVPAAEIEENETGDGETKEYGQVDAAVEASEIGADSNLAVDTQLQVESFSDDTYLAKISQELTGGSSREIRVVSEEDRQELATDLVNDLIKQGKEDYEAESGQGEYYLPTQDYQVTTQSYSAELDEEVQELSLEMTISLKGISYKLEDLKPLAMKVLEQEVPEDFVLLEDGLDIMSQPADQSEENETYQLEASLSGSTQAQLDQTQLQQSVLGLNQQEALTRLKSNSGVGQAQIKFKPQLSNLLFKNLPNQDSRIEIVLD